MRRCKKCGEEKELEAFPVSGRTKAGLVMRRWSCKFCYYHLNTKQQALRMRQWLEEYKKTQKCVHCGEADFRVLDFHHRDASQKSFEISTKAGCGWGTEALLAEIVKCDVVCVKCHRIIEYERRRGREVAW